MRGRCSAGRSCWFVLRQSPKLKFSRRSTPASWISRMRFSISRRRPRVESAASSRATRSITPPASCPFCRQTNVWPDTNRLVSSAPIRHPQGRKMTMSSRNARSAAWLSGNRLLKSRREDAASPPCRRMARRGYVCSIFIPPLSHASLSERQTPGRKKLAGVAAIEAKQVRQRDVGFYSFPVFRSSCATVR